MIYLFVYTQHQELLVDICIKAKHALNTAGFIHMCAIKDSSNKVFDGWDDFVYDLLKAAASLATAATVNKLYLALDTPAERLKAPIQ